MVDFGCQSWIAICLEPDITHECELVVVDHGLKDVIVSIRVYELATTPGFRLYFVVFVLLLMTLNPLCLFPSSKLEQQSGKRISFSVSNPAGR